MQTTKLLEFKLLEKLTEENQFYARLNDYSDISEHLFVFLKRKIISFILSSVGIGSLSLYKQKLQWNLNIKTGAKFNAVKNKMFSFEVQIFNITS